MFDDTGIVVCQGSLCNQYLVAFGGYKTFTNMIGSYHAYFEKYIAIATNSLNLVLAVLLLMPTYRVFIKNK